MTPTSSAAAYCTAAQLLIYHDQRQIADLVKDNDTRETNLTSNTIVAALLKRGAGDIEMACFHGKRYTPDDLNALTGVNREALIGLNADLTFWHLVKRRHPQSRVEDVPGAGMAFDTLRQLRLGELIFGFVEAQTAGLMETVVRQPFDAEDLRRTVVKAHRFFGFRSWR